MDTDESVVLYPGRLGKLLLACGGVAMFVFALLWAPRLNVWATWFLRFGASGSTALGVHGLLVPTLRIGRAGIFDNASAFPGRIR